MNQSEIKILITGDLTPVGKAEIRPGKAGELIITDDLKKTFRDHDLRITNLECPLTTGNKKIVKSGPHLKAHPESIGILRELNIDIACLSNNHIRDYDDEGVADTLKTCRNSSIATVGAGMDKSKAAEPVYIEINGNRLAILNFSETEFNAAGEDTAGSNPDDPIHIWQSVQEARSVSDFQVVILHGGKEMYPYPTPGQVELFRFVARLGVSAVIGHHSHVIGGYEIYYGVPLVYSLGNFLFDEPGNGPGWDNGAMAALTVHKSGPADLSFHYVRKENNRLIPAEPPGTSSFPESEWAMKVITDEIVRKEWDKLIRTNHFNTVKSLLRPGYMKRILFKYGFRRLSSKERIDLISLSNKFRCPSHRRYNIDSINFQVKINNK